MANDMVIPIPIQKVAKELKYTIKVTGMRKFKWTMKVARMFFNIGAWFIGIGLEIDDETKDKPCIEIKTA